MEIRRVRSWKDFVTLTNLVESNDYREYRCSVDEYCKWLNKLWYNSNIVMYIVVHSDIAIGYLVLEKINNVMRNDMNVINIYVSTEHQGKRVINIMIDKMLQLAIEYNLRIMWNSTVLPEEHWERYPKDFGFPQGTLKHKKVYWVDITDDIKDLYYENREKVIQKVGG